VKKCKNLKRFLRRDKCLLPFLSSGYRDEKAPLAEKILRNSGFLPNKRWQIGHVHGLNSTQLGVHAIPFFRINVGALICCDSTGFVIYYNMQLRISFVFYFYHSFNRKQIIRIIPRKAHTHQITVEINRFLEIYHRVTTLKGVKSASCSATWFISQRINRITFENPPRKVYLRQSLSIS